MLKCTRILGFCVLAVLAGQLMCAPITKTDLVTQKHDDATPKSPKEETPFKGVKDEDGAANYLKRFGYSNPGISKNSLDYRDELKESLKKMQKFYRLNVTGELDNDTVKVMNSPRCSLPDVITGTDDRHKRYVLYSKWGTNYLTYRIDNYPKLTTGFFSTAEIKAAINAGLQKWTEVANLIIVYVYSVNANIVIGFYSGNHGDGDPFDGRGGTLAHAFFPRDGRIHFDNEDTWSLTNNGYNLLIVATHESGHALGLAHSNDPNSVMYPTYQYKLNFRLGDDDIRGIQALYGANNNPIATQKPTTTTTLKPWTWSWFWNFFWG